MREMREMRRFVKGYPVSKYDFCLLLLATRLMNFYQNVHAIVKRQKVERGFHFDCSFLGEMQDIPLLASPFFPLPLNSLCLSRDVRLLSHDFMQE